MQCNMRGLAMTLFVFICFTEARYIHKPPLKATKPADASMKINTCDNQECFSKGKPGPGPSDVAESHLKELNTTMVNTITLPVTTGEPNDFESFLRIKHVDLFVQKLQGYISDRVFRVNRFEQDTKELTTELHQLQESQGSISKTTNFTNSMAFATHLFHTMVNQTAAMKFHCDINLPGTRLLYKLLELRVRSYAICDMYGNLDFSKKDYLNTLERLKRDLTFWGFRFAQLMGVPPITYQKFTSQYSLILRNLRKLKAQATLQDKNEVDSLKRF